MTCNVLRNGEIIETSTWHIEIGQDYWINYMNDNKEELVFLRFKYNKWEKNIKRNKNEKQN